MAKIFGVKVESFSLGFGPVLLHKTFFGTDWRLSLLPLGGYCGLKGEKDFEKALDNNDKTISGDKDSLYGTHPLKRAAIGAGGPLANLVFSWLALSLIATIGYSYYTYSTKVIMLDELDATLESAAHKAGLKTGDVIKSVNGAVTENFNDVIKQVSLRGGEIITITVDRAGDVLKFQVPVTLDKTDGSGKIGVSADKESLTQCVVAGVIFPLSLLRGLRDTADMLWMTLKSLATLFKGIDITKSVAGPASIIDMIGEAALENDSAKGVVLNLLKLLAFISISLFVMNMLPIPVLDGALILFALIETVTHKKLSPKVLFWIQIAGVALILLLFAVAVMGDINHFTKKP